MSIVKLKIVKLEQCHAYPYVCTYVHVTESKIHSYYIEQSVDTIWYRKADDRLSRLFTIADLNPTRLLRNRVTQLFKDRNGVERRGNKILPAVSTSRFHVAWRISRQTSHHVSSIRCRLSDAIFFLFIFLPLYSWAAIVTLISILVLRFLDKARSTVSIDKRDSLRASHQGNNSSFIATEVRSSAVPRVISSIVYCRL